MSTAPLPHPWPASVVELAQRLVQIPSVNPADNPGTPHTGEAACAEYVAELLQALGAEVEVPEILPGRPNVVGRWPGAAGRRRLLFAPHTDTVSVAGMTIPPFGGEVREGRLHGRGASDTKGTMAAMLWALAENRDQLAQLPWEIWFAGLMGEEAGQQGAKALAAAERFDFVIAGEPTNMQVVHTHKGCTILHLTTRGVATHASQPERGENAILKMLGLLGWVAEQLAPEVAGHKHELLGHGTLNVGTIRGGSKTNIVPDLCEAAVDFRTVPTQTEEGWQEITGRLERQCPGVEIRRTTSLPLYTAPEHPLIQLLQEQGAGLASAPWFCDAAVFAEAGAPAIAIGPGSINQAHTRDEFIALADLEAGAAGFAAFLRALR